MGTWEPLLERMVAGRYRQLVAYAMRLAPSRADAEDLVQDALVTTFSGRARFATEAEAEAYVRQAVASRFIDTGRRRSTERRALERHVVQTPVEDVPPPSVGLAPEVEAALALLAPRERACVVLRHMEDLSTRETAQLLHLSEGAVKRYLSDGVAALTAALGTELPAREPEAEIGRALWGAVDADATALDGLAPEAGELAGVRSRVRRGRTLRHVREVAVAVPVVAALVLAGWFGIDRLTQTPPAEETPAPVQPTPDETPSPSPTSTPSPEETEPVLGDPIDEPGVPTYYAMSDGVLDTVGPGWVLASYAPRWIDGPPTAEVVLAVSPEGQRFAVARFEIPAGDGWVEHVPVAWDGGSTAVVQVVQHVLADGSEMTEATGYAELDLASGSLGGAADPDLGGAVDGRPPTVGPDGRSVTSQAAYADRYTLDPGEPDSREVAYGVPGRLCAAVGWLDAAGLLADCIDEGALGDDGVPRPDTHHLLYRVEVDGGSPQQLGELPADGPFPFAFGGVWVRDGVVAFSSVEAPVLGCFTGVDAWVDGSIQPVQRPSERGENFFEVRASGGLVYVEATGGCSGDEVPRSVTLHDLEGGTTVDLLPAPVGTWLSPADDGAWRRTLTGWVPAE